MSERKLRRPLHTNTTNLAVVYVRVSSREQMEGYSIPAQKKILEEYAIKKGLQVVHVFEEAETAKASGRKQFEMMLQFLAKNPSVRNVLVEKTDRLYRNLKDATKLDPDETGLRIHFVKENEILEKGSRSQAKFINGIRLLMAKNYSDNLSEEVQKGQMEKASQGWWPSSAPIGYRNDRNTGRIEPDPISGRLITRAFELAATGLYSLSKLKRELYNQGLRSRRARNELGKEAMARVLRNPIYMGVFVWNGQEFQGKHTPLVSHDLFDRVQIAMGFVQKPRLTKHDFTYVGLVKCAHCGCAVTAERQKKKSGRSYVYYHCTNGKGTCNNVVYLREEKIEDFIAEALQTIRIPDDIVEWTRGALLSNAKEESAFREEEFQRLTQRYNKVQSHISQAYENMLEGLIERQFWQEKTDAWKEEQQVIQRRLEALTSANTAYLNEGVRLLELASRAAQLFKELDSKEKKEMVKLILSNPRILDGNLVFSFEKPFSMFTNVVNLNEWRS